MPGEGRAVGAGERPEVRGGGRTREVVAARPRAAAPRPAGGRAEPRVSPLPGPHNKGRRRASGAGSWPDRRGGLAADANEIRGPRPAFVREEGGLGQGAGPGPPPRVLAAESCRVLLLVCAFVLAGGDSGGWGGSGRGPGAAVPFFQTAPFGSAPPLSRRRKATCGGAAG